MEKAAGVLCRTGPWDPDTDDLMLLYSRHHHMSQLPLSPQQSGWEETEAGHLGNVLNGWGSRFFTLLSFSLGGGYSRAGVFHVEQCQPGRYDHAGKTKLFF